MKRTVSLFALMLTALVFAVLPVLAFAQAPSPPARWALIDTETANFITGKHGTDDAGHRWAAWRYVDADGFRYRSAIVVLRRDHVLQLTPPNAGESMRDYANRMWVTNVRLPCTDTAISSICDTARTALAATAAPEPPRFVVAKNGTTATRPVYALDLKTKTVGALIPGVRAPVGADCACWASGVRKNGTAMCTWMAPAADTRADQVTVCAKG